MKKILKYVLFCFVLFFVISFYKVDAITQSQKVVAYSDIYYLEKGVGQSTNGKRNLLAMFLNENGNIVVVWDCIKNGYKEENTLEINGETYTANELSEGTNTLTITNTQGESLKTFNGNLYYFAQELHSTQKIKDGFSVSITTSAGGHDLNGVIYMISKGSNYIMVEHDYKNTSSGSSEPDFDFEQSVMSNLVVGNEYSFFARENKGYSFINAVVSYPDGTKETFTDKTFSITAVSGATLIKFNYGRGYRVDYYYDNILDSSLSEFHYGSYGNVINTYTDKIKENYVLDYVSELPLTLSDSIVDPTISVYYKKSFVHVKLSFKHITSGDILDPTKTYDYVITYYYDGEEMTQNINLNNQQVYTLDVDENSDYSISFIQNIDRETLIYNGSSAFDSVSRVINGSILDSDLEEELTIYCDEAVLTGTSSKLLAFTLLLVISIVLLILFVVSTNNNEFKQID